MTRCVICGSRIWPWQSRGWYVGIVRTWKWHARCREAIAWHELPDA